MVFTSPSRVSRLVHNDIDRLGSHSKFNPTRKELTLPSILEVNEDPLSSPSSSSSTRTTTPTDITTMSTLLQELMLTLVTASTTSASASSPNMTPVKVKKASSTSFPSPSRLSHFDLTEHDIDGLSHIAPSLATSPMRVPSRSVSVSPSSLTAITETNEEIIGTSMEQTSALLRRLSLSLENVINSTPREPLQSPLSCQQSQRESYAIMTSPHKLKIPISASSSASPNFSPDVSPRTHRGPMMII